MKCSIERFYQDFKTFPVSKSFKSNNSVTNYYEKLKVETWLKQSYLQMYQNCIKQNG